ncbi:hypothetical protein N5D79_26030 [Pseudomonas sp. GD03817]|uniref:hypothetical protein n=1 Tax=Pseudomonas TaxID=286 RepID=UPI0024480F46|nr:MULTISPECIES: hypothetical protein [Pseudomonas]MDH1403838.1 hypothetical protein [Pseudomonas sp. GD03730]MDH1778333.1 hypothetical protein [Pseudomonas sp. GD03817]
MSSRYDGKVVSIVDETTVVINLGSDHGVKPGYTFLIVGLGEMITDPDTGEALGHLELVRGRAEAKHVQPRMTTLVSAETQRDPDVKEIKRSVQAAYELSLFKPRNAMTESVKVGAERIKPLAGPKVGDFVIAE